MDVSGDRNSIHSGIEILVGNFSYIAMITYGI
jgi:hypothetical protein